ncbi:protein phosphatase 2C domain-containing protein [Streptomyces sp. NPDC004539]|uniref:protein phosphatase 2C domain-containing protein n=1 Tax=Streptomyces sp. NPDC004539 TaxID=3154280 RepID=UPI0033B52130
MSQQGGSPTGRQDDWWGQLYDAPTDDTGPTPTTDTLDDRFASATDTLNPDAEEWWAGGTGDDVGERAGVEAAAANGTPAEAADGAVPESLREPERPGGPGRPEPTPEPAGVAGPGGPGEPRELGERGVPGELGKSEGVEEFGGPTGTEQPRRSRSPEGAGQLGRPAGVEEAGPFAEWESPGRFGPSVSPERLEGAEKSGEPGAPEESGAPEELAESGDTVHLTLPRQAVPRQAAPPQSAPLQAAPQPPSTRPPTPPLPESPPEPPPSVSPPPPPPSPPSPRPTSYRAPWEPPPPRPAGPTTFPTGPLPPGFAGRAEQGVPEARAATGTPDTATPSLNRPPAGSPYISWKPAADTGRGPDTSAAADEGPPWDAQPAAFLPETPPEGAPPDPRSPLDPTPAPGPPLPPPSAAPSALDAFSAPGGFKASGAGGSPLSVPPSPGRHPAVDDSSAPQIPPPPDTPPTRTTLDEPRPVVTEYVGSGPPTYDADPTALPLADPDALEDLVADTVLDGARYGNSTLRAVSLRGDSARYRGEPRRDALVTARFGYGEQALVLVAMATGARATVGAHKAAAEVCRWIGRAVGRSHVRLAEDIRAGRRGDLKSGLHRLTDRSLGRLRAGAAEQGLTPQEYTATLRCLLLPADPACRTRVFFGVGEGGLFRLRGGEWQDIEPALGEPAAGPAPTPYDQLPPPDPFLFRTSVARPGDTLLMCTGGLADPLRGELELAGHLTARWADAPVPGLAEFLADVQIRVKGYADDRTAAAIWEA